MITLDVKLFLAILALTSWSIFCNIYFLYKWHKQIKESDSKEKKYVRISDINKEIAKEWKSND